MRRGVWNGMEIGIREIVMKSVEKSKGGRKKKREGGRAKKKGVKDEGWGRKNWRNEGGVKWGKMGREGKVKRRWREGRKGEWEMGFLGNRGGIENMGCNLWNRLFQSIPGKAGSSSRP